MATRRSTWGCVPTTLAVAAALWLVYVIVEWLNDDPLRLLLLVGTVLGAAFLYTWVKGRRTTPTGSAAWSEKESPAAFWSGSSRPIPRDVDTEGVSRVIEGIEVMRLTVDDGLGDPTESTMVRVRNNVPTLSASWRQDGELFRLVADGIDPGSAAWKRLDNLPYDPGSLRTAGRLLILEDSELSADAAAEFLSSVARDLEWAYGSRTNPPALTATASSEPLFTAPDPVPARDDGVIGPVYEPYPVEVEPYEMPHLYQFNSYEPGTTTPGDSEGPPAPR